jgi:hypothetical protein
MEMDVDKKIPHFTSVLIFIWASNQQAPGFFV